MMRKITATKRVVTIQVAAVLVITALYAVWYLLF